MSSRAIAEKTVRQEVQSLRVHFESAAVEGKLPVLPASPSRSAVNDGGAVKSEKINNRSNKRLDTRMRISQQANCRGKPKSDTEPMLRLATSRHDHDSLGNNRRPASASKSNSASGDSTGIALAPNTESILSKKANNFNDEATVGSLLTTSDAVPRINRRQQIDEAHIHWEPPGRPLQKRTVLSPISLTKPLVYYGTTSHAAQHPHMYNNEAALLQHSQYFPLELKTRDYVRRVLELVSAGIQQRVVDITKRNLYPRGPLQPLEDNFEGDAGPLLRQLLGTVYSESDPERAEKVQHFFAEELLLEPCSRLKAADSKHSVDALRTVAFPVDASKADTEGETEAVQLSAGSHASSSFDSEAVLDVSKGKMLAAALYLLIQKNQFFHFNRIHESVLANTFSKSIDASRGFEGERGIRVPPSSSSIDEQEIVRMPADPSSKNEQLHTLDVKGTSDLFQAAKDLLDCFIPTAAAAVAARAEVIELEIQMRAHAAFQEQRVKQMQWTDHLRGPILLDEQRMQQRSNCPVGQEGEQQMKTSEMVQMEATERLINESDTLSLAMEQLLKPAEVAHTLLLVRLEGLTLDAHQLMQQAVSIGDYMHAERLSAVEFNLQSTLDEDLNREKYSETDYGLQRLDHIASLCSQSQHCEFALRDAEQQATRERRFLHPQTGAQRIAQLRSKLAVLNDSLGLLLAPYSLVNAPTSRARNSTGATVDSIFQASASKRLQRPRTAPAGGQQHNSTSSDSIARISDEIRRENTGRLDYREFTCPFLLTAPAITDERNLLSLIRTSNNTALFRFICRTWFDQASIFQIGAQTHQENIPALIISFLQLAAYDVSLVKPPCCTPAMLKAAGYTVPQLKSIGISLQEMIALDFSLLHLMQGGFDFHDLHGIFDLHKLKAAGFTVRHFRENDISLYQMLDVGFTLTELKDGGYTIQDLHPLFPIQDLKLVGFTVAEMLGVVSVTRLLEVGFTLPELKQGGFQLRDLQLQFTAHELRAVGFDRYCLSPQNKSHSCDLVAALSASDGLLFSGDTSGSIRSWQLRLNRNSRRVATHALDHWKFGSAVRAVRSLKVLDGRAYCGYDNGFKVWDLNTKQELVCKWGRSCYGASALEIVGTILYAGYTGYVKVWDLQQLQECGSMVRSNGSSALYSIHAHCGVLYAAYADGQVRCFDLATFEETHCTVMQKYSGATAATISDHRLYAGYADGKVRVFDLETYQELLGELPWDRLHDGRGVTSLSVYGSMLYVGSMDSSIFGYVIGGD